MHTVNVVIQFPALDNLVNYLQTNATQQKQIDDLAAQVDNLTHGLQQSEARLAGAIAESKA